MNLSFHSDLSPLFTSQARPPALQSSSEEGGIGSTLDLPMLCCPGWLLMWRLKAKVSPSGSGAVGTSVTEAGPQCRVFIP